MADEEVTGSEVLEEAIQENPDEVARFIQQVGLVNELIAATRMAVEGADDHVVTSVSNKSATLVEAADGLAQDDTPELAGTLGTNAQKLQSALEKTGETRGERYPGPVGGSRRSRKNGYRRGG